MTRPDPGRRRRFAGTRWAAPVAVAGLLALGLAAAGLAPQIAAATAGSLPARSARQLADSLRTGSQPPLSGTLRQTSELGLPELPAVTEQTALAAVQDPLVPTSQTARIWVGSRTRQRLAMIGDLSETDVVRNGPDVWLWDSSTDTASHLVLTDGRSPAAGLPLAAAGSLAIAVAGASPGSVQRAAIVTPAELAAAVLAPAVPGVRLSTGPAGRVAGRSVYELVVSPEEAGSLVGRVVIDLDASTATPLRVQVFAHDTEDAAFTTEFTAVRFASPKPALFTFTPPAAATVRAELPGPPVTVLGSGWGTVLRSDLDRSTAPGSVPSELESLLASATRVDGAFGGGRLIRTTLLSVLVLDDGRVFAGAVTPALLEGRASP